MESISESVSDRCGRISARLELVLEEIDADGRLRAEVEREFEAIEQPRIQPRRRPFSFDERARSYGTDG